MSKFDRQAAFTKAFLLSSSDAERICACYSCERKFEYSDPLVTHIEKMNETNNWNITEELRDLSTPEINTLIFTVLMKYLDNGKTINTNTFNALSIYIKNIVT